MDPPSVLLTTVEGKHKLTFEENTVVGTDYDDFGVIIPIICDVCDFRIFHRDSLMISEVHERSMGAEKYFENNNPDLDCPKCKSHIRILVEITEYASNFMFHDFTNENCHMSHTYDSEKLQ